MSEAASVRREETLRFRLKAATGALHRETERLFAMEIRTSAHGAYRDLLSALYGFYAPLEQKLAGIEFETALDLPDRLTKSAWIAHDLEALGVERRAIALIPRCAHLPDISSPAEAFGALYVTEGATLGGQVILCALKDRLGVTSESGGRFFASYGASIGPMWRRFVTALDEEGDDPDRADIVAYTAAATFRAFSAWLPPLPQTAHV